MHVGFPHGFSHNYYWGDAGEGHTLHNSQARSQDTKTYMVYLEVTYGAKYNEEHLFRSGCAQA